MSKLFDICTDEGIQVKTFSSEKVGSFAEGLKSGGAALQFRGEKLIVLDESLNGFEKQLVFAHEASHHLFGHLKKIENGEIPEDYESEARLFSVVYAAMYMFKVGKCDL